MAAHSFGAPAPLSPLGPEPFVSVIVPTYRRFEPVLATVRDLLAQRYADYEIIVADQNADWPAPLRAERDRLSEHPRVRWLDVPVPGVVAARNEAVQRSRGEVLVFVDDDVRIADDGFIGRHVANYADPRIATVSGREMNPWDVAPNPVGDVSAEPVRPDRTPLEMVLGFDRNTGRRVEGCVFSTCNCSVRRDVFLALGGFDENYIGNSYGDDSDFALRLAATGRIMVFDPGAALVHLRVPIGGLRLSDRTNATSQTDRVVSGWLFYLRHARAGSRWHILHTQILRRTILLRLNLVRPWRQPAAWAGLVRGYFVARRRLRSGVVSRFTRTEPVDRLASTEPVGATPALADSALQK
jgi:GT2 family glycosyltransferase